jgi:hypothetical protein
MKWRFAIKDGIEKHEERFINGELRRVACGDYRATERVSVHDGRSCYTRRSIVESEVTQ